MEEIIKVLLDENRNDNIILEFGDIEIEFEQVALILVRSNSYAILRPITIMDGIDNDEGLVFLIDDIENNIILIEDEDVIDDVYDVYLDLLDENSYK